MEARRGWFTKQCFTGLWGRAKSFLNIDIECCMMCLGGAESEDGPGFLEKESHKQRQGRVKTPVLGEPGWSNVPSVEGVQKCGEPEGLTVGAIAVCARETSWRPPYNLPQESTWLHLHFIKWITFTSWGTTRPSLTSITNVLIQKWPPGKEN